MQIYKVGGAVRDFLLGFPIEDTDFVVVGSSPEEMIARGFKPVGADFPVFLHPQTHEEYALARTERKSGKGYKGFSFYADRKVSLEEDLARRDLTINAIAEDANGNLIDPFNGQKDLQNKVLRHVSDAFMEDPVRILRLARFYARFSDFSIAPETMQLMQKMVANGEVNHLVAERIWQELSRGLMEKTPSRMILALKECGALAVILPEINALFGVPQRADFHPEIDTGIHVLMAIDYAAQQGFNLQTRFAVLMHDLGKAKTPEHILPRHIGHEATGVPLVKEVCERLKVPLDCRDLAVIVTRCHGKIRNVRQMRASSIVKLLVEMDAIRRPTRFTDILNACASDFHGRLGFAEKPLTSPQLFMDALAAIKTLNEGEIAQNCMALGKPEMIPTMIAKARAGAVKRALPDCMDDEN